jgi:hypothetical protein
VAASAGSYDQRAVSARHNIDSAIDHLDEALIAAGLPGLEPPRDVAPVAEIAEEVAPYVLPAELRRFWERVDAGAAAALTSPGLGDPAGALEARRWMREIAVPTPLGLPPVLLPFDTDGRCDGLIELGSEWGEGAAIFGYDTDGFELISPTLADRIDLIAELLLDGRFERTDASVFVDRRVEQARRAARLDAYGPHPVYGHLRTFAAAFNSWPAHWLAASGVDLASREPLGATHTLAELVAAAATGSATGRIHGQVMVLVGGPPGSLVVVDDGTGPLDVWCPSRTSLWGPVHRRWFEFELTIDRPVGPPPDLDTPPAEVTRHALVGDIASAQDAVLEFLGELDRHRAAAIATDIRPLD